MPRQSGCQKNSVKCRVETEVTSNQGQNFSPNVIKCSLSSEGSKQKKIKGCLIHRRILKNRPPPEEPEVDLYKLPLMKSTSAQRQSIHSINGAIGNNNKNKEIQTAVR